MGAAARTTGYRAFVFFYLFRLVMTLCVLPLLVAFVMNSFISALARKEELMKMEHRERDEERKYQEALEMNFNDEIGVSEEKQALDRVNLTLGHSVDASPDDTVDQEVERNTLVSMLTSVNVNAQEGFGFPAITYKKESDDSSADNTSSLFSNLASILPTLHFDAPDHNARKLRSEN